ncbi:MAG: hypothetical protein ACQSGP_28445 [Frankia sp.]
MTLANAVAFFVENHPAAPPDSVGGLRCSAESAGWLVQLFFLDANGKVVPTGKAPTRAYIADRIDDELKAALAGKEVLVFTP